MLNRNEILSILIITIVLGAIVSVFQSLEIFLILTLTVLIVILINIFAKKVTSFYLDTDIEIKIWELKQYGVKKHMHFKKGVQMGIFIPLIIKLVTVGVVNWMACLTFEASGKVYRAARKHGIYSFSEVSEEEIGWIAASGIFVTLVFAVVGYLIGQEMFAKISLMYAFFNMIPFFDLDGAKIFFGNVTLWSFLAVVSILGVASIIFIV